MSEKEKNIPKRRFKEFENDGAWEQYKLEELCSIVTKQTGFDYSATIKPSLQVEMSDTTYPFIQNKDFSGMNINLDTDFFIPKDIAETFPKILLDKPSILISISGKIGNVGFYDMQNKAFIGGAVGICKLLDKSNGLLILYELLSNIGQLHFTSLTKASSHSNITVEDIRKLPIKIPKSFKEKELIGMFFSKLDYLINLHQYKLEKIKSLKKAYLTEIFPNNGECKPKRRFAGFTDDWEQEKVKDICSISTGKSNTQDKIEDGKYPFYVRSPIIERSNRYLYDEEAVLTVGDGVGTGKVFHYVNGKYDLHQRVYRMFGFCNNVAGKYFYYYFSKYFYDRVMSMTAKTSVDSVRYEMIAEMDIKYPSAQEQKQIVCALEKLDNLITIHQRKLEKLQNMKKAYLKEMFI